MLASGIVINSCGKHRRNEEITKNVNRVIYSIRSRANLFELIYE